MHNVDISEYQVGKDEIIVYYGKVTISSGYLLADGDEMFYQYVGNNSCYSLIELIHPDDVNEFEQLVKSLDDTPKGGIIRLKCYNGNYRFLYVSLIKIGKTVNSFECFDMFFSDIINLQDKFFEYKRNIEKYRQFMSLSSDVYFEYDRANEIVSIYKYVNSKYCKIYKGEIDLVLEDIFRRSRLADVDKAQFQCLCSYLKNGADHFEMLIDATTIDNEQDHIQYNFKGKCIERDVNEKCTVGIIQILNDVERDDNHYYYSENALDPGTSILNKRAINEYAVDTIKECALSNESFYMAILDVDDFKNINDKFGHMYGDQVLFKVADYIKSVLGVRGFVGRFGGDEFMVVFRTVNEEQDLRRIIKTINKHITWDFNGEGENASVTTSWGIAKYPVDGQNYEELFKIADKCLYIAKRKGKNRYIIYDVNKHGDIENENESQRNLGIKAMESDEQKIAVISNLIIELHENETAVLEHAIEVMREYFDFDGVAVYAGEDMKRIMSIGNYVNPIQNLTCMNDKGYVQLFNEHGMYMESTINRLDTTYVEAYKLFRQQETGKFIQFASFENGVPKAVVAFDFFNRSPKLGTADMGMITAVGRLMTHIAAKI